MSLSEFHIQNSANLPPNSSLGTLYILIENSCIYLECCIYSLNFLMRTLQFSLWISFLQPYTYPTEFLFDYPAHSAGRNHFTVIIFIPKGIVNAFLFYAKSVSGYHFLLPRRWSSWVVDLPWFILFKIKLKQIAKVSQDMLFIAKKVVFMSCRLAMVYFI